MSYFSRIRAYLRGAEKGTTTEGDCTSTDAGDDRQCLDTIWRDSAGSETELVDAVAIGDAVAGTEESIPALVSDGANWAAMLQPLTDTELRASAVPIVQDASTYTQTRPSVTTSSSTVIAAGTRKRVELCNNSSVMVWVNIGAAAVLSQGIPLSPGAHKVFYSAQAIYAIIGTGSINLDCYAIT